MMRLTSLPASMTLYVVSQTCAWIIKYFFPSRSKFLTTEGPILKAAVPLHDERWDMSRSSLILIPDPRKLTDLERPPKATYSEKCLAHWCQSSQSSGGVSFLMSEILHSYARRHYQSSRLQTHCPALSSWLPAGVGPGKLCRPSHFYPCTAPCPCVSWEAQCFDALCHWTASGHTCRQKRVLFF